MNREQIAADIAWLERQRLVGHCGEGLADIKTREDHNERIDRIILALRDEERERLRGALKPFLPIQTRENQDYAEVTFGEHQTQAMTMAPADWLALNEAAVCRAVENKDE